MAAFPEKQLVGPDINPPGHDLNIKLNELLGNYYPRFAGSETSVMPDVPNAVAMGSKIYRVNAPGYFYKWSSTETVQSAYKSSVVIAERAEDIDTFGVPVVYCENAGKIESDNESKRDTVTINRSGCMYVFVGISDLSQSKIMTSYEKYRESEEAAPVLIETGQNIPFDGQQMMIDGNPLVTAPNSAIFYPCVINQAKKADPDRNNKKITYLVSYGSSWSDTILSGGHMNNMVPILPGVDGYCEDCNILHGSCSEIDGYKNLVSKAGKKAKDGFHEFNTSRGAPGTFVFYQNTSGGNVSHYFIPTLSNPPKSTVKPLTGIREAITNVNANKASSWEITDGSGIPSKTICVMAAASETAEIKSATVCAPDSRHSGIEVSVLDPTVRTKGNDSSRSGSIPGCGFIDVFSNQSRGISSTTVSEKTENGRVIANGTVLSLIGLTMKFAVARYNGANMKDIGTAANGRTATSKVSKDKGILDYLEGGGKSLGIYDPTKDQM